MNKWEEELDKAVAYIVKNPNLVNPRDLNYNNEGTQRDIYSVNLNNQGILDRIEISNTGRLLSRHISK